MTAIGAAAANPGQVVENLPSSLVGMKSAFGGGPAKELEPAYGMVFKFKVKLLETEGTRDLGKWQSCGGLKIDFGPQEVRWGGNYTSLHYLPGEVKYPRVVLKRAVEPKSSEAVQKWLRQAATDWLTGTEKDNPGDAAITLYDPNGKEVLTWFLHGVRPAAWNGPDLDATSSKVAIETLELVHEGFQVVAGPNPISAPWGARENNFLTLQDKEAKTEIKFANNPQKITVERTTEVITLQEAAQSGTGGAQAAGTKTDTTKLKMSELYIAKATGVDPVDKVDLLISWMGTKGDESTKTKEIKPPDLLMEWGKFKRDVKLSGLTVEYVRFGTDGLPTRAKVSVTLTVIPTPPPPPGNPSSGGIPGRSAHTLILDENLPMLAQEHYGSPARWRQIAEANEVDDPLRARPGTNIFLPAASELPARGSRP